MCCKGVTIDLAGILPLIAIDFTDAWNEMAVKANKFSYLGHLTSGRTPGL